MRRFAILAFIISFSFTQGHVAEAGLSLKVNFKSYGTENGLIESVPGFHSTHALIGTPEVLKYEKQMLTLANKSSTKTTAANYCKKENNIYNARIKVLDARRGTSGLGNLNQVTVTNLRVLKGIDNLPKMSIAEQSAKLDENPEVPYTEWPEYIESGYIYYTVAFDCMFSGKVAITSSNSYEIFVAPDLKPKGEYTKSELSKKKWTVTFTY